MTMKTGLPKLEETEASWRTNAPDDLFFDTSLKAYQAKVQLSRDADALVNDLQQQLDAAKNRKKDLLNEHLALEKNIAKSIGGSAAYGEDSDLWEGTGRIRKSERKTGLTRKKKDAGGT